MTAALPKSIRLRTLNALLASMVGQDALIVAVGEDFVKLMESSVENRDDEPTTVGGSS